MFVTKNLPSRSFAWSPDKVDTDGASCLLLEEVTKTDIEAIEDGESEDTLFTVVVAVVTDTAVSVVPGPTLTEPGSILGRDTEPVEGWRLPREVAAAADLRLMPAPGLTPISLGDIFPDTRLESEGEFD